MSDGKMLDQFDELSKRIEAVTGKKICVRVSVFGMAGQWVLGGFEERPIVVTALDSEHKALTGEYKTARALLDKIKDLFQSQEDGLVSCTCPSCKTTRAMPTGHMWCRSCGCFAQPDSVPMWFGLEVDMELGLVRRGRQQIAKIELK